MTVENKPIIVGIGELLWDMLPEGKRAGGAPINFVYHATQLGAKGYAISAVGNDMIGQEILAELDKSRIMHFVQANSFPTGTVEVQLNNGIPSYQIIENVAWDHIPLSQEALEIVKRADAVCFGTLALRHPDSRQTIKALLNAAPEKAYKFFDINLRSSYYSAELTDELLQTANVFKINDDEMTVVRELFSLSGSDEEICLELLHKYQLRYLIFTAGEKYSIIFHQNQRSYLATPKVKVADTIGAGDAFSGAFIEGLLTGKTMRDAHKEAVATAAYVCTQSGAWPKYNFKRIEEIKNAI